MAFENDPEGYRIACGYAGGDFDKPAIVRHELMNEYGAKWTFDEFQSLLAEMSDMIPPDLRSTARVYMDDPGYDCSPSLRMDYYGLESAETVAARVKRCEEYVAERRAGRVRGASGLVKR